jgi:uncharacterized protein
MRVWIDLANSPHVPLVVPIVRRLNADGHAVLLTARDHAQTVDLAQKQWPDVIVLGKESPSGRVAKARSIAKRARALREIARKWRPDVAFSHASYAQVVAARASGTPAVTMMDYEYQPANHLSFRLAGKVIVPDAFPESALRRFGAGPKKVVRYPGFKEELYLTGFVPDDRVLDELGLDRDRVIAVFRPPPDGALYHRTANTRFEDMLRAAAADESVQVVLLPRSHRQADRFDTISPSVLIPDHAIDGTSLLALADLTIGAGGTMNRESAILGTPTYTVFLARLAAVDAELIRQGRLRDLRDAGMPTFEKKPRGQISDAASNGDRILETVARVLEDAVR